MLTTATHIINTQLDIINKAIVIRDQNGVFIHYDPEQILLAFRRSNVLETELERAKRQTERERRRFIIRPLPLMKPSTSGQHTTSQRIPVMQRTDKI